jgi:hypothetical protein
MYKFIYGFLFFGVVVSCKNEQVSTIKADAYFTEKAILLSISDSLFLFTQYPSYLRFGTPAEAAANANIEYGEKMKFLQASGIPNEFVFDKWSKGLDKDSVINLYLQYKLQISNHRWKNLFEHYANFLLLGKLGLLEDFYKKNIVAKNYDIKNQLVQLIETGYENYGLLYAVIKVLQSKGKLSSNEIAALLGKIKSNYKNPVSILSKNSPEAADNPRNSIEADILKQATNSVTFKELSYYKLCTEF